MNKEWVKMKYFHLFFIFFATFMAFLWFINGNYFWAIIGLIAGISNYQAYGDIVEYERTGEIK